MSGRLGRAADRPTKTASSKRSRSCGPLGQPDNQLCDSLVSAANAVGWKGHTRLPNVDVSLFEEVAIQCDCGQVANGTRWLIIDANGPTAGMDALRRDQTQFV